MGLTESISTPGNPFKFLDAYTREDKSAFFGREDEVKKLMEYVRQNRMVFVYGPSGSGKTSLVRCGFANQFQKHEWLELYIRRRENINDTLFGKIKEWTTWENAVIEGKDANEDSLVAGLKDLHTHYLKPIFLIFDQFEELLINGTTDEKDTFKEFLKKIDRDTNTNNCNLIFIMREEYFTWLDSFQEEIQSLFSRRLRIDPITPEKIEKVVKDLCAEYCISLGEKEGIIKANPKLAGLPHKCAQEMVKKLTKDEEVRLPYLQVYLDQLWEKDYKDTLAENGEVDKCARGHYELVFKLEEIETFGNIEEVMLRFFAQRQKAIDDDFPGNKEEVRKVLACFITNRGTKWPVEYSIENGKKIFKGSNADYLNKLNGSNPGLLKDILASLCANRIIRNEDEEEQTKGRGSYELMHDILAGMIHTETDAKAQLLARIKSFTQSYFIAKVPIPYNLIQEWGTNVNEAGLTAEELKHFNISETKGRRAANLRAILYIAVALVVVLFVVSLFVDRDKTRKQNGYYAMYVSAFGLDSAKDFTEKLIILKYLRDYSKENVEKADSNLDAYMQSIALADGAQLFASSNLQLNHSEAVGFSGTGDFILLRDDSVRAKGLLGTNLFNVVNSGDGKPVNTFDSILYAYFIDNSDLIVLVRKNISAQAPYDYPDSFAIHKCNDPAKPVFRPIGKKQNGMKQEKYFLYFEDDLDEGGNPTGNRIQLTDKGNFFIPCIRLDQTLSVNYSIPRKMAVIIDSSHELIMPPTFSEEAATFSNDRTHILITHFSPKQFYVKVDERKQHSRGKINAVKAFANFSTNNNVIYREKSILKLIEPGRNDRARVFDSIPWRFDPSIPVTGDKNFLVIEPFRSDSLHIFDLKRRTLVSYDREVMVEVDFEASMILTIFNERQIRLRTLDGQILDTLTFTNPILYTQSKLTAKNPLVLVSVKNTENLDKEYLYFLSIKSNKIVQNGVLLYNTFDFWSISSDGSKFFLPTATNVLVFRTDASFFDVSNLVKLNNWIDTQTVHFFKQWGVPLNGEAKFMRDAFGIKFFRPILRINYKPYQRPDQRQNRK